MGTVLSSGFLSSGAISFSGQLGSHDKIPKKKLHPLSSEVVPKLQFWNNLTFNSEYESPFRKIHSRDEGGIGFYLIREMPLSGLPWVKPIRGSQAPDEGEPGCNTPQGTWTSAAPSVYPLCKGLLGSTVWHRRLHSSPLRGGAGIRARDWRGARPPAAALRSRRIATGRNPRKARFPAQSAGNAPNCLFLKTSV
jgi:hypothetical protein